MGPNTTAALSTTKRPASRSCLVGDATSDEADKPRIPLCGVWWLARVLLTDGAR